MPAKKILAPSVAVQELLTEKALLEREITSKQKRLTSINGKLRLLGFDISGTVCNEEQPLSPEKNST